MLIICIQVKFDMYLKHGNFGLRNFMGRFANLLKKTQKAKCLYSTISVIRLQFKSITRERCTMFQYTYFHGDVGILVVY